MAIVYAGCVWLFHVSPTTTYYIMGGIGVVAVASMFLPKKKTKAKIAKG